MSDLNISFYTLKSGFNKLRTILPKLKSNNTKDEKPSYDDYSSPSNSTSSPSNNNRNISHAPNNNQGKMNPNEGGNNGPTKSTRKPYPNRPFNFVGFLGANEDKGEFEFRDQITALIVHQQHKWLIICEGRTLQFFDIATKKHFRTVDLSSTFNLAIGGISGIDIDYNEDTLVLCGGCNVLKLSMQGDVLWSLSGDKLGQRLDFWPSSLHRSEKLTNFLVVWWMWRRPLGIHYRRWRQDSKQQN